MSTYKHFNFNSYVAVAILDDCRFSEIFCYFRHQIRREECHEVMEEPSGGLARLHGTGSAEHDRELFERAISALRPLIEAGLVVIGKQRHQKKTSFGHYEIDEPTRSPADSISRLRDEYEREGREHIDYVWVVAATELGWGWANRLVSGMAMDVFQAERADFFSV